ncbi:5921_t:CDS:2 [Cetraspora pellucida]|uniref:5921_t:CDS:1 n=1 Tax=Cetraspora pellucida TaxID=1433469 RepID=A0A9N8W2U1_9GLOM|nr:5921_t:CDS:2 [Cetraspora pellucida]
MNNLIKNVQLIQLNSNKLLQEKKKTTNHYKKSHCSQIHLL